LYVLRSVPTGKHYIGTTGDIERRIAEHNSKNDRWTSRFKSWELVVTEEFPSRSAAVVRERFLKSWRGMDERRRLFGQTDYKWPLSW
jgi:putative endonuclease